MVSYCSRECQKKHWKHHKEMCKVIMITLMMMMMMIMMMYKVLTKMKGGSNQHLFHNDPSAQPRVTRTLEMTLGRQLTQFESDILTHAR